jgi:hydrogenase maturation protein HypF
LAHVADSFLHHTRPIVRPADDSVFRFIAQKPRPIRLARGYAPQELQLNQSLEEPVLAVGGHLKNTIALAWDNRLVVSPHIGELSAPLSLDTFAQLIHDLQRLYRVKIKKIIHDAHPNYASTRWAKAQGKPCYPVLHHHAHAAALAGEYQSHTPDPWLIFVWDGVGYGADHSLWGGEVFYGQLGAWQHVGHWRPFYLPGGEKAGREPWRSAAALCWEAGVHWQPPVKQGELIYQAWQRRLNCPRTTAAGRLFDAAAALLGLVHCASYEAQGPMLLEAMIHQAQAGPVLPVQTVDSGCQLDWEPLLAFLLNSQYSIAERASGFHHSLAQGLCAQAQHLAQQYPVAQVGLCGGVFQNQYLTELSLELLNAAGFNTFLSHRLPCNDAAISAGQVMEFSRSGLAGV